MKKPKIPAVKKVVVTTSSITDLKPDQKPAVAHEVADKAKVSAPCLGSPPCQNLLAIWVGSADALDVNLKAQEKARDELLTLEAQEPVLLVAYDSDACAFASAVQSICQSDFTIATQLGLTVRADAAPVAVDTDVPADVHVALLKKTGAPRLMWTEVPGVALYIAQISVDPATDPSWGVLFGHGKSRLLPPLTPGVHYLLRVASVSKAGKQSAWSDTVSIIGK